MTKGRNTVISHGPQNYIVHVISVALSKEKKLNQRKIRKTVFQSQQELT